MGEVTFKPGTVVVVHGVRQFPNLFVLIEEDTLNGQWLTKPFGIVGSESQIAFHATSLRLATIVDMCMMRQQIDDAITLAVSDGSGLVRDPLR